MTLPTLPMHQASGDASGALAPVLQHLRAEPSRTWSLIITLYGDAVVPRGGTLWLGTLLEIFAALDIGGNVVRTAMSRLAADGWLLRTRVGRNAFYRLAEKGRATFAEAARRIYGARSAAWDGAFHLAVLRGGEADAARAALRDAGYAALAPGVLVAVAPPDPAALAGDVLRLRATTDADSARRLAGELWPGERLAEDYRRFIATFTPLRDSCAGGAVLSDLEAMVARLLLVHEYRRLVLRDPLLPDALLGEAWPGTAARHLCGVLYPLLLPGSERWLDGHGMDEEGRLPAPDIVLAERFR
jgi:phenylacetic acid degradation operon negative regulatory protein